MGFRVCELARVPSGNYEYYLYLGGRGSTKQLQWLEQNFSRLASEIGPDAVIVQGHDFKLSDDLVALLTRMGAKDIAPVFDKTLCAVLSQGHIIYLKGNAYVFPLTAADDESDESRNFIESLMNRLVDAVRRDTVEELLEDVGVKKFPIERQGSRVSLATLRRANDVLQLNPGLFGISLNLNALVNMALDRIEGRSWTSDS